MFDDLRIPRQFGFVGGILLFLVGISVFFGIKNFFEQIYTYPIAVVSAYNTLGLERTKQLFSDIQKKEEQNKTGRRISTLGATLWGAGFLLLLIRSLWGPQSILMGTLFHFWADVLLKHDSFDMGYDGVVLLLALVLYFRWKKESAL